jgi:hypothetical protein
MNYTHNLKLIFVDDAENIIDDEKYMDEIKQIFDEPQSHIMEWNRKREVFTMEWKRQKLNKLQSHFMGDLFMNSIYETDSILYNHTRKTINGIKSKYKIHFYISKVIGNRQNLPDFIGII